MHLIKRNSGLLSKLLLDEALSITVKSLLIAHYFRLFDYPKVLSTSIDHDAMISQYFKKCLLSPQIKQEEISAIIYSIYTIYKFSEKDDLLEELFTNLLPLAFHGAHAGNVHDKIDKRQFEFLSLIVADLIECKNDLSKSYKVKVLIENELNLQKPTKAKLELAK